MRRAVAVAVALCSASVVACSAILGIGDLPTDESASSDAGVDGAADAVATDGSSGDAEAGAMPTPHQLAPLSTSRALTRRPTLKFAFQAGASSGSLDLCLDRACTNPIGAPIPVTGTSITLASDLPARVIYWRITAAGVTGPTWQFSVTSPPTPNDVSFGTTLDVNGDGFADLLIGASSAHANNGRAYLFLGSASGVSTTATKALVPEAGNEAFGAVVASAGDVNGDGYADAIIAAPAANRALIYFGGASGISDKPNQTIKDPGGVDVVFGGSATSIGDVNGDGYADVLIGAPNTPAKERAYVYLGSPNGLIDPPFKTLEDPNGSDGQFAVGATALGDTNGDGFDDFAIGSFAFNKVYIYKGDATSISLDKTLQGPSDAGAFGVALACGGDDNGDGRPDLIVGAPNQAPDGTAAVFLGTSSGITINSAFSSQGPAPNTQFGGALAGGGDLNGDGFGDIVVGADGVATGRGAAFVYYGATVPGGSTTLSPYGDAGAESFGRASSIADINGDGYSDVIVGAFGASTATGRAYVFLGRDGGVSTTAATMIVGPDGTNGFFGVSLFGASN